MIHLFAVLLYPRILESCSCRQSTSKPGDFCVWLEWKIEWSEFGFKLQTRSTVELHLIATAVCCLLNKSGVFFFKEDLKVPDKEYGQIKKWRHCNEKKWKRRYSARRKVEGGLCLFLVKYNLVTTRRHIKTVYRRCISLCSLDQKEKTAAFLIRHYWCLLYVGCLQWK